MKHTSRFLYWLLFLSQFEGLFKFLLWVLNWRFLIRFFYGWENILKCYQHRVFFFNMLDFLKKSISVLTSIFHLTYPLKCDEIEMGHLAVCWWHAGPCGFCLPDRRRKFYLWDIGIPVWQFILFLQCVPVPRFNLHWLLGPSVSSPVVSVTSQKYSELSLSSSLSKSTATNRAKAKSDFSSRSHVGWDNELMIN